jgi:hypothetical protein
MMPPNAYFDRVWLHGVVATAEFAAVEEHVEDFRVVLGRDTGGDDTCDEQSDSAKQGMEEREDRSSRDQSGEEQPSLCSQDRQRPVHGLEDFVGTTFH